MTLDGIRKSVEYIQAIRSDDEMAHSAEDDLRESFIEYLAENANDEISEMAREILKTNDIEFSRWCA